MFRALAVIAAFAFLVYAIADLASSDDRDRGGIPRWLWAVIIVCLPYFGPLSWITFSRSRRRQGPRTGHPSAGPAPRSRRPAGPLAPDDDPEFLWRLAREQQNQARGTAGTKDAAPESPTQKPQGTSGQDLHDPDPHGAHGTGTHEPGTHDQTTPPDDKGPDAAPQP